MVLGKKQWHCQSVSMVFCLVHHIAQLHSMIIVDLDFSHRTCQDLGKPLSFKVYCWCAIQTLQYRQNKIVCQISVAGATKLQALSSQVRDQYEQPYKFMNTEQAGRSFVRKRLLYRWTWIWQTRWDQENWSVICTIRRIHMTNTWYTSDWDQAYRPSYAKIRRTVVRHIQVHLYC